MPDPSRALTAVLATLAVYRTCSGAWPVLFMANFDLPRRVWPYEDVVPGLPRSPPGAKAYVERLKHKEDKRAAR